MSTRTLCEEVAGGLRDGRSIKALQIGGPLGGILPASKLDTAFDFDALAAEGCMVGHGSILAFDDQTNMRAVAIHLLRFGAHESCGKCFPCRIGLKRAYDEFSSGEPVDRARFEALLETLELSNRRRI
jgi:formate dehydrogenase iron-sulfur subunit